MDLVGMVFRLPPRSFLWSTASDANSLDSRPYVDHLPCDAASVRRRSIAVVLLRGIPRCHAADRDVNDDLPPVTAQNEPVSGNLGGSLPDPLDFVSDKALTMSPWSLKRRALPTRQVQTIPPTC
jgi:hypothetical protein